MTHGRERFDIAIIGSGISGSTLGAILARHGLRVIIFEAGVHPKFAVGESMILETSETMRQNWRILARRTTWHALAPRTASSGTSVTCTMSKASRKTWRIRCKQLFHSGPTAMSCISTGRIAITC